MSHPSAQVLDLQNVRRIVEQKLTRSAVIADTICTSTLPSESPLGPGLSHFDVRMEGELLKLVFSVTQRPLLTEFGELRTPMMAPTALFDAVRH